MSSAFLVLVFWVFLVKLPFVLVFRQRCTTEPGLCGAGFAL
jgi:hypothetical protein